MKDLRLLKVVKIETFKYCFPLITLKMSREIRIFTTDLNLDGSLQADGLNSFSGLRELVGTVPVCLLYLPEEDSGFENWHMYASHLRLWRGRGNAEYGGFALTRQRPDKNFTWHYLNPSSGKSVEGVTYWRPLKREHENNRKVFFDILEGTHESQERMPEPKVVEAIVDCTDHPGLKRFLEREGYTVVYESYLRYDWPERK